MNVLSKANAPTIYFIGVTTGQSSIMKLFPQWAKELGFPEAQIVGLDFPLQDSPERYFEAVRFIKEDKLSLGALVTTHKIDVYNAAKSLFDYLDPYAVMFQEISCISKSDGTLAGHAKDPLTSGLAIEAFLPTDFWSHHGGDAFIIGAGGAALAISSYLSEERHGDNIPSRIILSDPSQSRLESAKDLLSNTKTSVKFEYVQCRNERDNDLVLASLKAHSLVVNATGLGKDRPGSPLTDSAVFSQASFVWELNYRGELNFMHQALQQQGQRDLTVNDGWIYFIHGWTQVIAEVFHIAMDQDVFERLERIAANLRMSAQR